MVAPRRADRRQAGMASPIAARLGRQIQCRSANSLPYARCRLRSTFIRASHRLTLAGVSPERGFPA